jgi:hypothetical protein
MDEALNGVTRQEQSSRKIPETILEEHENRNLYEAQIVY